MEPVQIMEIDFLAKYIVLFFSSSPVPKYKGNQLVNLKFYGEYLTPSLIKAFKHMKSQLDSSDLIIPVRGILLIFNNTPRGLS